MLACLSPADSNFDDNLSTLQSACVITHCTAGLREQPHKLQRCANSFLGLNSFARVACQYAVIPSSSLETHVTLPARLSSSSAKKQKRQVPRVSRRVFDSKG